MRAQQLIFRDTVNKFPYIIYEIAIKFTLGKSFESIARPR